MLCTAQPPLEEARYSCMQPQLAQTSARATEAVQSTLVKMRIHEKALDSGFSINEQSTPFLEHKHGLQGSDGGGGWTDG